MDERQENLRSGVFAGHGQAFTRFAVRETRSTVNGHRLSKASFSVAARRPGQTGRSFETVALGEETAESI